MATDRDQFSIASATGVDVTLDVAGPGSRSFAFIIDWSIRAVLAFAWFAAAAFLITGRWAPDPKEHGPHASYYLVAVLTPLAIYFLYHPIVEAATRGRSPGKRIAGVRLVTQSGATPSLSALLIRNVFRIVDSMPVFYVLGLVTTFVTEKRVRIGDLAAGTVLVHDRGDALDALAELGSLARASRLDTAALEVAQDLLARWQDLNAAHRASLARAFLAQVESDRDPRILLALDDAGLRARVAALVTDGGSA